MSEARENHHMDNAAKELWVWMKGIFNRHRIRHIDGFGYVAEVWFFWGGWHAIKENGRTSSAVGEEILSHPSLSCKTMDEAGERVNKNAGVYSAETVWIG